MPGKKKYGKLKRLIIVLLLLVTAFFTYVEIVNRNSVNMTYRQKFLKAVYPAWMWWANLKGKNTKKLSNQTITPPASFYSLRGVLNDGSGFDFSALKGEKVLLVNTASDCGYTDQYADLEKLYRQYKDKLLVIAFPANDFKDQEKGDDSTIAAFCKKNYGISFPLMAKSSVVKGSFQNPVFKWLTDPALNGWNDQQPSWNFCKFLVDENGRLVNYFGSSVQPFDDELINAIKK
jgi:glutathione peroxidase